MDNLKKKVTSGLFWSVTQAWSDQTISLVVFVILARILLPEAFGAVAIASIFIGILALFVQQGFATSIIQRTEVEAGHLNAAFWMNLASGVIFAGVAYSIAGPVSRFYEFPELVWVIRLLSLNLVIVSLTEVQRALLSKDFKFRTLALRSIVATTAGGAIGIVMALKGFGVYSLVAQQLLNGVASLVVLWSTTSWRPGFLMEKRHFHDLWGFGLKMLGSGLLNKLRKKSDVLILSVVFGPVVVGYYTIAMKPITMIVTLFTKVVSRVALPAFSLLQAEPERLRRALSQSLRMVAVFLFPVVVVMILHGDILVEIFFGEAWGQSGVMLRMLALWGLSQSVVILVVQCVLAQGRPGVVMGATGVLALAGPVAMLAAVPFGVYAVVAANVVVHCLIAMGFLVLVRRSTGFSWRSFALDLRSPVLGAVGLAAIFLLVGRVLSGRPELIVGLALGGPIYGGIVLLVEKQTPATIFQELKGFLPERGHRKARAKAKREAEALRAETQTN